MYYAELDEQHIIYSRICGKKYTTNTLTLWMKNNRLHAYIIFTNIGEHSKNTHVNWDEFYSGEWGRFYTPNIFKSKIQLDDTTRTFIIFDKWRIVDDITKKIIHKKLKLRIKINDRGWKSFHTYITFCCGKT